MSQARWTGISAGKYTTAGTPIINVNEIDLREVLSFAEKIVKKHDEYEEYVRKCGQGDHLALTNIAQDVFRQAVLLDWALARTGIRHGTNQHSGDRGVERQEAIRLLEGGLGRLFQELPKNGPRVYCPPEQTNYSLFLDPEQPFHFDATAIAQIRLGSSRLRDAGAAPDQAEAGQAEGEDAGTSESEMRETPAQKLAKLQPAARKAYLAFQYAESKAGRKVIDQEAYDLLKEEGIPEAAGNTGDLTDYEPPSFDTWTKHLRIARAALGEQKYMPRGGRRKGKSIVRADQIEQQKRDGD